jgi:hypothetical protein
MIDRNDVLIAVEALRAITRLDSKTLARLALEHNATLMRVAAEVRWMASGHQPYMPMITAADYLERVAKGEPGQVRVDMAVFEETADMLERLAYEPPVETPNRHQRRAMAARK